MKLLIVEGGIHGSTRNCGQIATIAKSLCSFDDVEIVYLSEQLLLENVFVSADAYLLITGTYWDSCGSPMQKFIEDFTHLECDARIAGKPVGVIVLCHTVGGKTVLSRLQGVMSSMGFMIPPLSGMVISKDAESSDDNDSWSLADMDTVLRNLLKAASITCDWALWPVNRGDYTKTWINAN